ncbi:DUF1910 domain-containing protein [Burkholderia multivorans]|uniref:PoNe immunity protein domain-containing protein n=1 Tax=Burkholderia multivorans TaxID=87883 RepID=UPI001C217895|nr:PoNe immunity protein domain-containing protein [Burkholderia multivorans]MBU9181721.1 DUF1910 domain-containing protein [Burkholderia multivorans]
MDEIAGGKARLRVGGGANAMIRDKLTKLEYWDKWIEYSERRIEERWARSKEVFENPAYRPQYLLNIAKLSWQLMFERYSRGDSVASLAEYFPGLLDAWEESVAAGEGIFTPEQKASRRSWVTNLDFYIISFWLVLP